MEPTRLVTIDGIRIKWERVAAWGVCRHITPSGVELRLYVWLESIQGNGVMAFSSKDSEDMALALSMMDCLDSTTDPCRTMLNFSVPEPLEGNVWRCDECDTPMKTRPCSCEDGCSECDGDKVLGYCPVCTVAP